MSGYSGFSMSNNAVAAYEDGLRPASKISGIPAALVEQFASPREWHHSSSRYNRVNFFDPAEVRAIFGLEESEDTRPRPEAVAALAEWKVARKAGPVVHESCRVEWLEWSGSVKHPTATECVATGCTVSVKGATATITTPAGRVFTKRLKTRGFAFTPNMPHTPAPVVAPPPVAPPAPSPVVAAPAPVVPVRRPMTAEEAAKLATLPAADRAMLLAMPRRARKDWMYAAGYPACGAALDALEAK